MSAAMKGESLEVESPKLFVDKLLCIDLDVIPRHTSLKDGLRLGFVLHLADEGKIRHVRAPLALRMAHERFSDSAHALLNKRLPSRLPS